MTPQTPSAYADYQWPADLKPSVEEAHTMTQASLYYLTGTGQLPSMPAGWTGGEDRWNQQIDYIKRAAEQARRVQGVPSSAGPMAAGSPAGAAADRPGAPASAGRGGTIALVLLGLGAAGGALWWWRHRRGRSA